MKRISRRFGLAVALALGTATVVATPAQAATGVTVVTGFNVIQVLASPGVANNLTINHVGDGILINDTSDTVTAGNRCTALGANTVSCAIAGIFDLQVSAGDLNDTITTNVTMNSFVSGEAGEDTINSTGSGFTNLFGGAGNDRINGGPGNDFLQGGLGADVLDGGAGQDFARYDDHTADLTVDLDGVADDGASGEGDNVLPNIEILGGSSGNDTLTGNDTNNRIVASGGTDVLNGLGGNDDLVGGGGNDTVNGGAGDDVAGANGGATNDGADTFSGGDGTDTANYALRAGAHNISLDGVANDGLGSEGDNNLTDVENATGGASGDTIAGNTSANTLVGGFGNDTLNGLDGEDLLLGEGHNDTLNGGTGADNLEGGEANDLLSGGGGDDTLSAGAGPVQDPDGLFADADVFNGGSGADTVSYAGRTPNVAADIDGTADDGVAGETDNILNNVENITGGNGSDNLTGNVLGNVLRGGNGNDILDVLDGIDGNDTADGMAGEDICVIDDGDAALDCEQQLL